MAPRIGNPGVPSSQFHEKKSPETDWSAAELTLMAGPQAEVGGPLGPVLIKSQTYTAGRPVPDAATPEEDSHNLWITYSFEQAVRS